MEGEETKIKKQVLNECASHGGSLFGFQGFSGNVWERGAFFRTDWLGRIPVTKIGTYIHKDDPGPGKTCHALTLERLEADAFLWPKGHTRTRAPLDKRCCPGAPPIKVMLSTDGFYRWLAHVTGIWPF